MSDLTTEELIRSVDWMGGFNTKVDWHEIDWRDAPNVYLVGRLDGTKREVSATFRLMDFDVEPDWDDEE